MSHTHVLFPWSKKNEQGWIITTQDLIDKKYTYYYNGNPIHTIVPPYIIHDKYMVNVNLIDNSVHSQYIVSGHAVASHFSRYSLSTITSWLSIDINDIQNQSDLRNTKLNNILK